MDLEKAMIISASGLRAQSLRMRVIAENLANQDSIASEAGGRPYRRKVVSFGQELDRASGVSRVKIKGIKLDQSAFPRSYAPGHPSADENGYILKPNVTGLIEATDMREAQRSYEANLSSIEAAKQMTMRTLDLLR